MQSSRQRRTPRTPYLHVPSESCLPVVHQASRKCAWLTSDDAGADVTPAPGEVVDQDSLSERSRLLQRIEQIELPINFLDELVERLGGPDVVAEMTGRKGRVVRSRDGSIKYQLRAKPDSSEMDSLNIAERDAFQKGNKLVAIISDAASTGVSLHSSLTAANQRRRMHFTIELPWSADKAIQQLGRTHRSNQASAPLYVLTVTNLGGEKRFAAAVARRLQSLGALTRGDRQAASGLDLSQYNLDSPLGRKALRVMYDAIVVESPSLPHGVTLAALLEGCDLEAVADIVRVPDSGKVAPEDLAMLCVQLHSKLRGYATLMGIGLGGTGGGRGDTVAEDALPLLLAGDGGKSGKKGDLGDVRRFLNRILGLPVACQNLLFNYFMATLAAEIKAAKAEGRFVDGVSDLPGRDVKRLTPPAPVWVDQLSNTITYQNRISLDRGMSYEAAVVKLEHEHKGQGDRSGFRLSKRPMFGRTQAVLAIQRPGRPNTFSVHRPNTGLAAFDMDLDELLSKYKLVQPEDVQELWTSAYETSTTLCMHGEGCTAGPECQVGRRLQQVTVLSGSIVRVWGALESVLERNAHALSRAERAMRVVRVNFDDGTHIVGVRYPPALIPEVQVTLQSQQVLLQTNLIASYMNGKLPGQPQPGASAAIGRVTKELPTPVDQASLKKAFQKPKTVLDFFKPKQQPGATAPAKASDSGAKASGLGKHKMDVHLVDLSDDPVGPLTDANAQQPSITAAVLPGPPAKRAKQEGPTSLQGCMRGHVAGGAAGGQQQEGRENREMGTTAGPPTGPPTSAGAKQAAPTVFTAPVGQVQQGSSKRAGKGMQQTLAMMEDGVKVSQLVAMGFAQELAVKALRMTRNDLQQAANFCASHC